MKLGFGLTCGTIIIKWIWIWDLTIKFEIWIRDFARLKFEFGISGPWPPSTSLIRVYSMLPG